MMRVIFELEQKRPRVRATSVESWGEVLQRRLAQRVGKPNVVDRALIYPPQSQLPPLTPVERESVIKQSSIFGHYEKVVDRESAYEMLKARAPQAAQPAGKSGGSWQDEAGSLLGALGKSAARAMGSQVGREIVRGVLGSIFGSLSRRTKR